MDFRKYQVHPFCWGSITTTWYKTYPEVALNNIMTKSTSSIPSEFKSVSQSNTKVHSFGSINYRKRSSWSAKIIDYRKQNSSSSPIEWLKAYLEAALDTIMTKSSSLTPTAFSFSEFLISLPLKSSCCCWSGTRVCIKQLYTISIQITNFLKSTQLAFKSQTFSNPHNDLK